MKPIKLELLMESNVGDKADDATARVSKTLSKIKELRKAISEGLKGPELTEMAKSIQIDLFLQSNIKEKAEESSMALALATAKVIELRKALNESETPEEADQIFESINNALTNASAIEEKTTGINKRFEDITQRVKELKEALKEGFKAEGLDELIKKAESRKSEIELEGSPQRLADINKVIWLLKAQKIAANREDYKSDEVWKREYDKAMEKYWKYVDIVKRYPSEAKSNWADANKKDEEKIRDKNTKEAISQIEDKFERKLAEIEYEYSKKQKDIKKDERLLKKYNLGILTEEQRQVIDEATELNDAKRQKAIAEAYRAEFGLMRETLREYGTYQQRKLAIATEYGEKIKKAGSEAERESLGKERDSLLAGVEAQELKANIDWGVVFGEFGGMFHKVMAPVLADAKSYMQTDEFKNADHASQEVLINAVRQMERSMRGADNLSFKRLGNEINEYQLSTTRLREAQEEYRKCYDELQAAQEAHIKAQSEGTEAEIEAAEGALATARENEAAAAQNAQTLQDATEAAQRSVSDTAAGLKGAMDGVVEGLRGLASGSLSGAYNGLKTLSISLKKQGGKLGEAFGKVADALDDVPILGWIVSIIDVFKDGLSVVIGGLLDAVFNAVSGILDDILSGDLFVTLGESILSGVGKIFDAITWGGFSSWFGSGDSDKSLEEDIQYLTTSNKDLKKAIDNLAEKMNEGSVAEAQGIYEEQKRLLEDSIANTQEMMQRSGAAYSNGFLGIGGHQSSNRKINEGMTSADWKRISDITGKAITSAGAFFGLSSEDMAKVFNEANDLYSKIKSLAADGYKDAAQYMDDYIEYYRQLEELQDALREKLTGMSFSSLRDNFKSQLLDMESDAESFGENLDEMLFGTIVESLMSDKYGEMLKDWYKSLADAMAGDGKLDDRELEALRKSYQGIVDQALSERNAIADAIGYESDKGSSQSGKAGGFNVMSQDQGTKLEGLFTSVQMHTASIDENMENVIARMNQASDHLRKIEENTGRTADTLYEVKESINKIIRDGVKTK